MRLAWIWGQQGPDQSLLVGEQRLDAIHQCIEMGILRFKFVFQFLNPVVLLFYLGILALVFCF